MLKDTDSGAEPVVVTEPSDSDCANGTTLHDGLVRRLRQIIIEGDLIPGQRIPERVLCERFKISRTPLREALKVLAWEGFIDLTPNRGATVSQVTVEEVDEVFPVIGAVEALSGELACERITEKQLAEIKALHYQMVLHFQREELPEYFRLNQKIHEKIMEAADNKALASIYWGLAGRIRRARYVANMSRSRWAKATEEHEAILAALEKRDGTALARILKEHLRNKCDTVKEALAAGQTDAAAQG